MTPTERRDLAEERSAETYQELFEAEVERQRQEWEAEFGRDNPSFPFKIDGRAAHKAVIKKMTE